MTSKLTRERIEWLNYAATGLAANGTEMAMSPQDVIALTKCCLAAMDSGPVYQVFEPSDGVWVDVDEEEMIRQRSIGGETRTLYTAPVAPEEITIE